MHLFDESLGLSHMGEAARAASVCQSMGIPHFIADLSEDFRREVIDPFITAYEEGFTPNPCIFCNRALKFGALLDFAAKNGYDRLATGHYAKIEKSAEGRHLLRRAADLTKDQSYMLYTLSQSALSRVDLPLGDQTKTEVRAIAESLGLPMAKQKDSQDICFIPDGDYVSFIRRLTGKSPLPGNFVSTDGNVLGTHRGTLCYTIGQRKGLNIGGHQDSIFVIETDIPSNIIYVGEGHTHKGLSRSCLRIDPSEIHWIRQDLAMAEGEIRRYRVRIRYRQPLQEATVIKRQNGLYILFDEPQRGITPGQFAVWYDGDEMLGSGVI
jgi:tRNA-specific 2-thiouridylase